MKASLTRAVALAFTVAAIWVALATQPAVASILVGTASGANEVNKPVLSFEWIVPGDEPFDYYVSESARSFSLRAYMDGFNPVYTDDTTDGAATRGPITDTMLAHDPVEQGNSHISFYSSLLLLLSILLVLLLPAAGAGPTAQRRAGAGTAGPY